MITVRPSSERGHAQHGWLDSRHTFSFADYHDPRHMGFRALRVINEDHIAPGQGFGRHSHRDMEILTWVIAGALEHGDSLGNGSVIRPGELQRLRAGTGVTHSEFNASASEPVHLLQIWLLPDARGLAPAYAQRAFPPEERRGRLRLLASRDGADASLEVHQDVALYDALLEPGERVAHRLEGGRHAWVQMVSGAAALNATELRAGDGVAVSDEPAIELTAREPSELLLFDLA